MPRLAKYCKIYVSSITRKCSSVVSSAIELHEDGVAHITDPNDQRVVIYRNRLRRDHREYQNQVRSLAARALVGAGEVVNTGSDRRSKGTTARSSAALNQLDCVVGVHYSWDCLRRLCDARALGRQVVLDSVLVPSCAPSALLELARNATSVVYTADLRLIREELSKDGSSHHDSCNFIVAYPVRWPLRQLRPPFLVLDGLGASQNIGQILRTAYHLGVTSVICSRPAWNGLNGRACRVSMGWMYNMDFCLADPLSDALQELRARNVTIYAAEDHFATSVAPHEPLGSVDWALIVGHEDEGVSAEASSLSDVRVCIPQSRGESLNVAHAAAICLYELGRGDTSRQAASGRRQLDAVASGNSMRAEINRSLGGGLRWLRACWHAR